MLRRNMMKIKYNLASFEPVPEGEQILEITKAEAKPSGKPNTMHISFKDKEGRLINNRYDFTNPGGLVAFGLLCRTALGMKDSDEFDTVLDTPKFVGKKLLCEIVHNEGTQPREDGTLPIFANIKKVISLVGDTNKLSDEDLDAIDTVLSPRQQIGNDLD